MALFDFILNFAALLLWLSWRSANFDPLANSAPATLIGALKRTEPRHFGGWHFLVGLAALLAVRAWLYWRMGSALNWVPNLHLGAISIFFRSDVFQRMLLFSALGFIAMGVMFYYWLLLLSLVNGKADDPVQQIVRLHLGIIDRWHWPLKLLLPLFTVGTLWLAVNPLLIRFKIIQPVMSGAHRFEQAAVIALSAYLCWKYLLAGLLLLGLVSTYVYLGNNSFWHYINTTSRNLLRPLRPLPLRMGKFDFAPILGLVVVFLGCEMAERGLTKLYAMLPL